jgi:hypothetical protein
MIDINKTYRTRDGREVRIYATDGIGHQSVHGAYRDVNGAWSMWLWSKEGVGTVLYAEESVIDLIEVKPRIQRTMWVNVYPRLSCTGANHSNKKDADQNAACNRIACVKVEIDCEEGEGL